MTVRQTLREAATSRITLAVFGLLALSAAVPAVVDIYDSPVYRLAFLPSYLVTLLLYDNPFGLENLVYPVSSLAESISGDGHLVWEAGRLLTFYLFALAVGTPANLRRGRSRPPSDSTTS